MRLLLRTLIYVGGSLIAFLIFLITTESGLHVSFNLINYVLGNDLKVKSLEGRLIDHIKMTGFSYHDEDTITINHAELDWQPLKLLKKTLHINKLIIENGNFKLSKAFHQYPIPDHAILHNISFKNIVVTSSEFIKPIVIKQFNFDGDSQLDQYAANILIQSGRNQLNLNGKYNHALDLEWNIQAPNLEELLANSTGSITSQGKITKTKQVISFNNETAIRNLHYEKTVIPQLLLKTSGTDQNHQIQLSYNNNVQTINLALQGRFQQNLWLGKVTNALFLVEQKNVLAFLVGSDIKLDHTSPHLAFTLNSPQRQPQTLAMNLLLPNLSWQKIKSGVQSIQGKIIATDQQLELLTLLFPTLKMTGTMTMNVDLNGTLKDIQPSGVIALEKGETLVSPSEISLKNINLKIISNKQGILDIQGTAESGKGTLKVAGKSNWRQFETATEITLTGTEMNIVNTADYTANIIPQLTLNWSNNTLFIKGQVTVPSATIKPATFNQTLELPRETIFTDIKKPTTPEIVLPFRAVSDIKLILGDKVTIQTNDISGKLQGELMIHDENGIATSAEGEITISEGKYQAYGQPMTIREGRLIFTGGPIDNPGIRLIAYRTINLQPSSFNIQECRDITSNPQLPKLYEATLFKINIGIQVTGRLDDRQVTLFSEPSAFSQSDMLSLLILGTPMCLVSQGQAKTLLTAVSAMSISGSTGTQIQQQIAKTFGLDVFEITSATSTQTTATKPQTGAALVLGKALTPKIYISYIFNALTNDHTVRVRYSLTNNWIIQSEQSKSGTAADILYTFER